MRKIIGRLCILIVGLQILIGVPLAVCLAFFAYVQNGGLPAMTVELRAGPRLPATVPPTDYPSPPIAIAPAVLPHAPPPNIIPAPLDHSDNPILLSRADHGSPLAGTVLADDAESEQQLFLTALEKAAAEHDATCPPPCDPDNCQAACPVASACEAGADVAAQLLAHLYAMSDLDEQTGNYDRADQWRALARDLRSASDTEPLH
jgi:hypothetical protein